ncbi:MAG: glycerol-3-phosphate 1-O-acyltransferase PlsY [Candidatus Marinimicrobia bacterium]|nr:glycerol-3-phosphate 1-O-acyltransferase PlsY [Candidatus Neomarinimicrobiota bacterium]
MNVMTLLVIALAYLIGSFPTAWVLGKIFGGRDYDIREHGSGNVGTTNVIRNLGWKAGAITFIVDAFKGFAVVWWMPELLTGAMGFETARVMLATAVIIGHTFPVYIRFRGGKAVATTAGIIFAFRPEIGLICMAAFVITVLISRQSGVGSIVASFFFPISVIVFKLLLGMTVSPQMLVFSLVLPFFIVFTHRENIVRILRRENKKDF